MIFQELAAAPELSVAENVVLGQLPAWHGLVNWRAVRATAGGMLAGSWSQARSRCAGLDASGCRAPDDRDCARAPRRGALPYPRRADSSPVAPRGRTPLHLHPTAARARRRDHLHHPPPRRGRTGRRPSAGAEGRGLGARRPRPGLHAKRARLRDGRQGRCGTGTSRAARARTHGDSAALRGSHRRHSVLRSRAHGRRRRGRRPLRKDRIGNGRGRGGRLRDSQPERRAAHSGDREDCSGKPGASDPPPRRLPACGPATRGGFHDPVRRRESVRAVLATACARRAY